MKSSVKNESIKHKKPEPTELKNLEKISDNINYVQNVQLKKIEYLNKRFQSIELNRQIP